MRLDDYPEKDEGMRVWLAEREIRLLNDEAKDSRQRAAFLLGDRCGLRRAEITNVEPQHVHQTDIGTVLRIWESKTGYREVPVPPQLATIIQTLGDQIEDDEPVVDVTEKTVYRWVSRAGQRLAERTEDEGWEYLGPHDLRRTWGVRALEEGILPSVVFHWGGWEDWETFKKHYLNEFSPEALRRERSKVDWLREVGMEAEEPGIPGQDYSIPTASFSHGDD